MAGNVETLKDGYAQFDSGDVEGALSNWSDDFEWDGGESDELPGSGVHKGKDSAMQVLQRAVGAWDSFKFVPDEYIDGGDTVVVLGHDEVSRDAIERRFGLPSLGSRDAKVNDLSGVLARGG